jgi:hypothetical protein
MHYSYGVSSLEVDFVTNKAKKSHPKLIEGGAKHLFFIPQWSRFPLQSVIDSFLTMTGFLLQSGLNNYFLLSFSIQKV